MMIWMSGFNRGAGSGGRMNGANCGCVLKCCNRVVQVVSFALLIVCGGVGGVVLAAFVFNLDVMLFLEDVVFIF